MSSSSRVGSSRRSPVIKAAANQPVKTRRETARYATKSAAEDVLTPSVTEQIAAGFSDSTSGKHHQPGLPVEPPAVPTKAPRHLLGDGGIDL